MPQILLGLGANVGDPLLQLSAAVGRVGALVEVERVSGVYRTEPVGFTSQPDFLNIVVVGRSDLPSDELMRALLGIERELGRERSFRNAPRLIDIDLLAYGDDLVTTEDLVLPHPRMHERAFVLVPLLEVFPDWIHPTFRLTPAEMLATLGIVGRAERVGDLPPPA